MINKSYRNANIIAVYGISHNPVETIGRRNKSGKPIEIDVFRNPPEKRKF